jgi:hypothetical protein
MFNASEVANEIHSPYKEYAQFFLLEILTNILKYHNTMEYSKLVSAHHQLQVQESIQ